MSVFLLKDYKVGNQGLQEAPAGHQGCCWVMSWVQVHQKVGGGQTDMELAVLLKDAFENKFRPLRTQEKRGASMPLRQVSQDGH